MFLKYEVLQVLAMICLVLIWIPPVIVKTTTIIQHIKKYLKQNKREEKLKIPKHHMFKK